MPRKRRPAVKKYHDRVAGRYDASYDDAYWQWHDSLTWDHLKGFLPGEAHAPVIDLGCGTGKWGLKLLESGCAVTFLDISHQMVDQARDKVEGTPGEKRASFVQADISNLSALPADGFALATALGEPIACTPEPAKTLRELRRIIAPGGVLVATFDNRLAAIDFFLQRGDAGETARFLHDGKTHWLTSDADERFPIIMHAPDDVRRLVENAGFVLEDMIAKTVLPMRKHRELLAASADRRTWAKIEKSLWRDPAAIGRASHIQTACRVPGVGA